MVETISVIQFKSLQQRFSILALIPVAVLTVAMGFAGFSYARNQPLTQWGNPCGDKGNLLRGNLTAWRER